MKNNYKRLLVLSFSVMFGFVMAACDSTNNSNSNSVDDTSSSEHTHSYTEEVTKEATCTETGIKTFTCECGDTYTEEISKAAHALTHHEAHDSTCETAGNIEHWVCDTCGEYFLKDGPTTAEDVVIPAEHKHLTHVEAVEATCYEAGNVEHWVCSDCKEYFLDAAATSKTTAEAVVLAAGHKHLTHVEAVEATCYEAGNVEHWVCSDCNEYFLDAKATNKTTAEAVVLAAGHKHLTHVEAVEATCYEAGNVEHWVCSDCNEYFLDAAATSKTTAEAVVVSATGEHVLGDYYVVSVANGVATVKHDCVTEGCTHSVSFETAAPTNYSYPVDDEEALASLFTIDRTTGTYTFEWVNGVLKNTNSEVKSSHAYITLTATTSGTITFDTAVWSESNYDTLTIYVNDTKVYSSKVSNKNNEEITKSHTITVNEGDVIKFDKYADNSSFYGPDGDKDYAKISNIRFIPTEVPSDVSYVVVSFDTLGGNSVTPVVAYSGFAVESLPTASKDGYYFLGWTSDANNEVAFDAASGVSENTTVYAKWMSHEDACALYGDYVGKNVYGAGWASGAYSLSIDVLGNMTGYLTGTITNYDPSTGVVTWTNGTATGVFLYDASSQVVAVASSTPMETIDLGSDYYVFACGSDVEITSAAFCDYSTSSTSYVIKLIQFVEGEDIKTVLIKDGVIYSNVTYTSLFGTITDMSSIKTISDVVIKDASGNVLVAQGYNGSKLVDLDAVYGIYTNETSTLKVSGINKITLDGVDGTYVYEDGVVKANIDGTYYEITLDGDSFTALVPMTTVVYNTLGGNEIENASVNTTKEIGTLPVPTKDGYVFRGWYLNENCSGRAINSSYAVSGETLTIYAKWVEAVTLTFNSNEGSAVESITLGSGESIEVPEDPSREGYRFDGWYTDNTYVTVFEFTDGITSNTEVVAKWVKVWNVTVYENTGSEEPVVYVVDDSTPYTIKSTTSVDGATFEGWYTTSTFDVGSEYVNGSEVAADVVVYAKWKAGKYANNAANYIDSFDTNGYIETINFEGTYPWATATYNDVLWMVPTNQGKGSSLSTISFTMAKDASMSFDFLASSEGKYDYLKVTVNGNEIVNTKSLGADSNSELAGSKNYVVSAGDVVEFTYSKDGSGNQQQDTVFVKNFVFADLANYTVTLVYNDSTTENGNVVVAEGESTTLPTPTREGYAFKGWYDGTTAVSSSYTPTADVTLTAKWAELFTVTFNLNNGSDPVVLEVEELTMAETTDPVKDGFVFVGWYLDEALTNKYEDVVTSDLVLYAKYIETPAYVGTYKGVEVWGSSGKGSYSADKSLTISDSFAMTGGKSGTVVPSSYNEETGVLSYTSGSSTYLMYFVSQGGYDFIVLNYSASTTDAISGTDYYVYVKGATSSSGTNANQYVWDKGAQRVFSITIDETVVVIYINEKTNTFYGNVSLSTLDGTAVEATNAGISAAASLKITSADGSVVIPFAKDGAEFIALDGVQGTYSGSLGTITLDGAGVATVGEETTTYVVSGSKVEVLVGGVTKTITLSGDAYALTTDGTEGTYTGEAGEFVSNGDGTATLAGVAATYVKNGLNITYTCNEVTNTILLNEDGTYLCKTAYAGFVYSGTYYSDFDEANTSLTVNFDDGATLTGTIVSGTYPAHTFGFSAVIEGNVITFTITSETYKEGCVGKTVTATISDSSIVFDASSDLNNIYSIGGATVNR